MKLNYLKILGIFVLLYGNAHATVYENAQDGKVDGWVTLHSSSTLRPLITNVNDTQLNSKVISLSGDGYNHAYMLGNLPKESSSWNNTKEFFFQWKIKNSEGFLLDLVVETKKGVRYIRYSDSDTDLGFEDGDTYNKALGYKAANGEWHTFTRDIRADIKGYDASNDIVKVTGLIIRGNCKVDDIELMKAMPKDKAFILYEDAEDGAISRWKITDNVPAGATVKNVKDAFTRVIKLHSTDSYANQYKLNFKNNRKNFNLKWDMKTQDGFIIDILVNTSKGERFVRYTDENTSVATVDGDVLLHGLGYAPTDGNWHTIIRDLKQDITSLEPNNKLISVESFLIRANAKLDNVELFTVPLKVYEDAENGKTDNWEVYSGGKSATISNVYDKSVKSKVISLKGSSYADQYIIGGDYPKEPRAWNDTKHKNIQFSMQNSGGFILSLVANTSKGVRYLNYFDVKENLIAIDGDTLNLGLGEKASNGEWHTYIRDIEADLQRLEPKNKLLSVEGLIVVGSVKIDNLELFNILHPSKNKAGIALTFDDTTIKSWYDFGNTFKKYGAKATFFVSHFFSLEKEDIAKLKVLESNGCEIGCHTYDHKGVAKDFNNDITKIDEYIKTQIKPAYDLMKKAGFNPVSFAYPYGENQDQFDEAVRKYFPYIRLTYDDYISDLSTQSNIFHNSNSKYNLLYGAGIDADFKNSIEEITAALIEARKNGEVVIFYAHDIVNEANREYNILPQTLEKVIENAKNLGLKFYTYKEVYQMGNQK